MAMIDPEQERQRLLDYYSRQMDGRLEQIATQAAGLSELAREVLKEELIRRGLDVELLQPQSAEVIPPTASVAALPEGPTVAEQESLSGELDKRNLVTIRKFRDPLEALMAQGRVRIGWNRDSPLRRQHGADGLVLVEFAGRNQIAGGRGRGGSSKPNPESTHPRPL